MSELDDKIAEEASSEWFLVQDALGRKRNEYEKAQDQETLTAIIKAVIEKGREPLLVAMKSAVNDNDMMHLLDALEAHKIKAEDTPA